MYAVVRVNKDHIWSYVVRQHPGQTTSQRNIIQNVGFHGTLIG